MSTTIGIDMDTIMVIGISCSIPICIIMNVIIVYTDVFSCISSVSTNTYTVVCIVYVVIVN